MPRAPFAVTLMLLGCRATAEELPTHHMLAAAAPVQSPTQSISPWYVDKGDNGTAVTTCASDANTCTSATCGSVGSNVGPCQTVGQIVTRWQTWEPRPTGTVTVNLLSDDASEANDYSPIQATGTTAAYFAVNGSLNQVGAATIGTVTQLARTPPPGQTYTITAQGQTGAFWSTFLWSNAAPTLVHDTTANAYFWVEADLGNATARITTPLATAFATSAISGIPAYVTIGNGDSLVLLRPTKAALSSLLINRGIPSGHIYGQHLWITGGVNSPAVRLAGAQMVESYVDSTVLLFECPFGSLFWINSLLNASSAVLNSNIIGGAIVEHSAVLGACPGQVLMTLDGDVLVDTANSRGLHFDPSVRFGRAWLNASVDYDGCFGRSPSIGTHDSPGMFYADAELWGPAGLDMEDGCSLRCESAGGGSCTTKLLLAGALTANESTTAQPYNASTGSWGSAVTITPAAIDDAGALCNVSTGDCWRH